MATPTPEKSQSTAIIEFLTLHPTVEFINYYWVDLSGVLRSRVIPKSRCVKLVLSGKYHMIGHGSSLGLCYSELPPGSWITGGYDTLYPDWSSLRLIKENAASVLCCLSEENALVVNPSPNLPMLTLKFERCPRSILNRLIQSIEDKFSISFLAGFELEFYLLSDEKCRIGEPEGYMPDEPNTSCQSTTSSLRGIHGSCLEECVRKLQFAGVDVEQFHAESGPQQYEISTGPLPVLEAVDTLMQSQEIIRCTAANRGLRACFLPRPFRQCSPTGLHAHLSLSDRNGVHSEYSFLAGILKRLPRLCAFGMASQDSYLRLGPKELGNWVSWGNHNRDTPIRRVAPNHFEFRAIDATSNVYLCMAGYIGAGILGIEEQQELLWKDCKYFLSDLSSNQKIQLGIIDPMPNSLADAVELLEQDSMGLERKIGSQIIHLYLSAKKGEAAKIEKMRERDKRTMYLKHF